MMRYCYSIADTYLCWTLCCKFADDFEQFVNIEVMHLKLNAVVNNVIIILISYYLGVILSLPN
jgi:hypothetical protein